MCAVKEVAARYHRIGAIGFRKADFRISDKISVGSHGLRLSIEKNKKDDDEMSEKLNSNKTITNAQQGTNKQLMKEKHNKHEKSMLVSVHCHLPVGKQISKMCPKALKYFIVIKNSVLEE